MNKLEALKKVCVVGLGYIGLPTAVVLASRGYRVTGVDINPEIINCISSGSAHINEPGLNMLLEAALVSKHLLVTSQVEDADIFIIAVDTPQNDDRTADLRSVLAAFESVSARIKKSDLIIIESTCPVGTTEILAQHLTIFRPDLSIKEDIFLAYCPERVLPGQTIQELIENDRVIGGINPVSTKLAIDFYRTFVNGNCLAADCKTAEMCKLAENSYRDVNVAFANELSMICDQQGINVWELIKLANHHPRVNILQPGAGVGGHCVAIDPWFLINQFSEQTRLLKAARDVNELKPEWIVQKANDAIVDYQQRTATNPTVALFGITFKANADDIRESPALQIAKSLLEKQTGQIIVVEPNLDALPESLVLHAVQHVNIEQAIERADILVTLVAHDEFKIKPQANTKRDQIVFDFAGLWSNQ